MPWDSREMASDEEERPLWFITLTQTCNLTCTYCGSGENFEIEDLSPHPREVSYDFGALTFLKRERPGKPIVCFYGGEPLLRIDAIRRVMNDVLGKEFDCSFVLQTNGLLLDRLGDDLLPRFSTILVSVDGDAATTDLNRGPRVYERAVAAVSAMRSRRSFSADTIARMTVGEWTDIERDVMHLVGLGVFDHVHWQLDVLWDSPKHARWDDFIGWRDRSYNPGITRLAERFAAELGRGHVLGIAPFLGIAWGILACRPATHVRCSSGHRSFNVTTGGLVTSCPIAADCEPVGRITDPKFDPVAVHGSVPLGGDGRCERCSVFGDCGGRCLYASRTDWWGADGFDEVCAINKHLIAEVRRVIIPAANEAIASGRIKLEQLHYPPFNNTVEIIP